MKTSYKRPLITLLGFRIESVERYQFWEEAAHNKALFGAEKDDIGQENTFF
jgi:hypothetical protein